MLEKAYAPKRMVPTTVHIPINDFDDVGSWIRLSTEDVAAVLWLAGTAEPDELTLALDAPRAPWRR